MSRNSAVVIAALSKRWSGFESSVYSFFIDVHEFFGRCLVFRIYLYVISIGTFFCMFIFWRVDFYRTYDCFCHFCSSVLQEFMRNFIILSMLSLLTPIVSHTRCGISFQHLYFLPLLTWPKNIIISRHVDYNVDCRPYYICFLLGLFNDLRKKEGSIR